MNRNAIFEAWGWFSDLSVIIPRLSAITPEMRVIADTSEFFFKRFTEKRTKIIHFLISYIVRTYPVYPKTKFCLKWLADYWDE